MKNYQLTIIIVIWQCLSSRILSSIICPCWWIGVHHATCHTPHRCTLNLDQLGNQEKLIFLTARQMPVINIDYLKRNKGPILGRIEFRGGRLETMPVLNAASSIFHIDLEENQISCLNRTDYFPAGIKDIILHKNKISYIVRDCFAGLKHLKLLNLNSNRLLHFDLTFDLTFEHLVNFWLAQNPLNMNSSLISINANSSDKRVVVDSDVSNVFIDVRSSFFGAFPRLKYPPGMPFKIMLTLCNSDTSICNDMYLSNCDQNRTVLKTTFFAKRKIRPESFDRNMIATLDEKFSVDLTGENMSDIPDLGLTRQVDELCVDRNYVTNLTRSEKLSPSMEVFSAVGNKISLVSRDFFARLARLKIVRLQENFIKSLAEIEFNSNQLSHLNLSKNEITDLKKISLLNERPVSDLTLDLDYNQLTDIPTLAGNVTSLRLYTLAGQNIKRLQFNMDEIKLGEGIFRIGRFVLAKNRIDSYEYELFCRLNANLIIERLDVQMNQLDGRFVCDLLDQPYVIDSFNVHLFPQHTSTRSWTCADLSLTNKFDLENQLIFVNCQREHVNKYRSFSCSNTSNYQLKCKHQIDQQENFTTTSSSVFNADYSRKNVKISIDDDDVQYDLNRSGFFTSESRPILLVLMSFSPVIASLIIN